MTTSQLFRHSECVQGLRRLRAGLALGLAALLFFASQGSSAYAQQQHPFPAEADADFFVTYHDAKGRMTCRGATADEKRRLREIRTSHLDLRPLTPAKRENDFQAQAAAEPQKIILRGTPQLDNYPEAKAAFIRAAQMWEQLIRSPITIYIDVDYGPTRFGEPWGSALGSTSSPRWGSWLPSLRTHLIEKASTPEEVSLYNSLPETYIPTDTINRDIVLTVGPVLRALGYGLSQVADPSEPAPRIGFNSAYNFDFDPSDGIDPSKFDFEAVAAHEIGHALGFTSYAGGDSDPSVWDLFRFRTGTTLETFGTAQRIQTTDGLQFYFSGGEELPLSTGGPNGQGPGGDGNQSSHWKESVYNDGQRVIGIMDPRLPYGTRREVNSNDANALNYFGYDVDVSKAPPAPPPPPPPPPPSPPPPNDNFADAEVLDRCGSVDGTNRGATRETGEPYHHAGSGASAWYVWRADATGFVTFNTEGSRTNYASVMAIYSGDSLTNLYQLYRDDGYGNYSSVSIYATAGETYRIAVDGYLAAQGDFVLNWSWGACVPKADQSITFAPPADVTYGDAPFAVSATASSGLPVSLSVLSGPATVSGHTVTVNGAGPVTIRASQSGDASYKAAPTVDQTFVVNKAPAAITLGGLWHSYDGTAKSAKAVTTPSGLSGVVLAYSQNGAAVTTPTAAGSYTVTATLNNDNYQAEATGTMVIAKARQTITFNPLPNKTYGDPAFSLAATASSGLPVSFRVVSGPATVSGNKVTLTGGGTVKIRATQSGSAEYAAAAYVDRSFVVNKATATLTLGGLGHVYNGTAKRATAATSPAGLTGVTISYSQNGVPVAAPVNAGSYLVRASLSNSKYQAADVTATLVVTKSGQTISFAPLANRAYLSGSFNVAATSSSRLPVAFRVVSGPAKISGTTVTVTGVGTVVIRASQTGNSNYNAAALVDRSFAATKAAQAITFDLLPSKTYGEAPFALAATSSSGLPVTFQVVSGPATLNANKLTLTGAGKVTVRATQAGNLLYNAASAVERAFDVTSAHPNMALRGLAFTYDGTAKSATVLTQPAGLNVTVSYYTPYGVSVTPTKAGSYKVVATINDAGYRGTTTGTLVINKAVPVVNWGNPAAVAPGTVLGAAQLNATANVPGTFKYAPAAGLVLGAGTYQLSVTFTPADAANHSAVTKRVMLTVSATAAQALGSDTAGPAATLARFANVRGIFELWEN